MLTRAFSPLHGALLCSALAHAGLIATLALAAAAGHGVRQSEGREASAGRVAMTLVRVPASIASESAAAAAGDTQTPIVARRLARGAAPTSTALRAFQAQPTGAEVASVEVAGSPPVTNIHAAIAMHDDPVDAAPAYGVYYFASSEVDVAAHPQAAIEPELPQGSESQPGYLVMRMLISERGEVDRIEMLVSEPEGLFDESVVAAFSAARFVPALREGYPVKSQKVVELKIEPDARAVPVIGAPVIVHQSTHQR